MKLSDLKLQDIGTTIQLAGAIYASGDRVYLIPLPRMLTEEQAEYLRSKFDFSHDRDWTGGPGFVEILNMAQPEWEVFLRQTDLIEVEVLEQDENGNIVKAIRRKSQYQIDQNVSWRVYKRDQFFCRYCGIDGVPMTVDHLIPWEEGGPATMENLVTACRPCNKIRGTTPYAEWLRHPYYKKNSQKLIMKAIEDNEALVHTLDKIPRKINKGKR
jgi:hypothetical protein